MKAKYEIVKDDVVKKIKSGEYPDGFKLPNLKTFCARYDVSEITVKRAMMELVGESYVHRVNGKGTFVGLAPGSPVQSAKPRQILFVGRREWGGFWTNMMLGAQKIAEERGYQFMFYVADDIPKDEAAFIRTMNSPDVAGVIFNSDQFSRSLCAGINEANTNVVVVDFAHEEYDYVDTDNITGASAAVEHLYDKGHRKIGFLTPRSKVRWAETRLEGYFKALDKLGVPMADRFVYHMREGDEGLADIRELLNDYESLPITAMQCCSDIHAMCFVRICLEKGIAVPENLAVSGFGNVPELELFPIPLTSVDQNSFEEGELACSFLIDKIDGKITERIQHRKKCKLIVRQSTAKEVT